MGRYRRVLAALIVTCGCTTSEDEGAEDGSTTEVAADDADPPAPVTSMPPPPPPPDDDGDDDDDNDDDDDDDDTEDTGGETTAGDTERLPVLSHETDIQPIWNGRCNSPGGCHNAVSASNGVDLQTDALQTLLAGTHFFGGMRWLTPGDPQQSYVFRKIEGTHMDGYSGNGDSMPPGGSLGGGQLATIEAWIEQGAPP